MQAPITQGHANGARPCANQSSRTACNSAARRCMLEYAPRCNSELLDPPFTDKGTHTAQMQLRLTTSKALASSLWVNQAWVRLDTG